MKKLALISGLLFVIVYFCANIFMPEDDNDDTYYPETLNNTGSGHEASGAATLSLATGRHDAEPSGEGYYLILASFNDISQARQAAETYRNNYCDDIIVLPPTPEGNYRISYGRYHDLPEAESALANVRQTINSSAWLLAAR